MKKDFTQEKLLSFDEHKQFKVLFDLASIIEEKDLSLDSNEFVKLTKYHQFLESTSHEKIQKLNKEFAKVKFKDYQFQVYMMNLERLLGQSKKDYQFMVNLGDKAATSKAFPIACLLDSIRSAHNIGSFFRNAECFGVKKVILTGLSPTPENIQVQKTSMGTHNQVSWQYQKDPLHALEELRAHGHEIWGVETAKEATHLNSIDSVPSKLALVFGHEQFGMSLELLEKCDKLISIELFGSKNSLNVAVSQAVVLSKLCQFYK